MITTDRFNPHPSLFIEFHGILFLTRGGKLPWLSDHSSVPIRWRWGTRCTANFSAASTSCSFGTRKVGGVTGSQGSYIAHRTQTERNKPYSYVEQKTAVLCDEHPHVPSCVCVSFLASTTSDVCQTIKTSATPTNVSSGSFPVSHAPTLVFFKLSAQKISKGPRQWKAAFDWWWDLVFIYIYMIG